MAKRKKDSVTEKAAHVMKLAMIINGERGDYTVALHLEHWFRLLVDIYKRGGGCECYEVLLTKPENFDVAEKRLKEVMKDVCAG